jgi:hypothetical protein
MDGRLDFPQFKIKNLKRLDPVKTDFPFEIKRKFRALGVTDSPKGDGQRQRAAAATLNVLPRAASGASNGHRRGARLVAGRAPAIRIGGLATAIADLTAIMTPLEPDRSIAWPIGIRSARRSTPRARRPDIRRQGSMTAA